MALITFTSSFGSGGDRIAQKVSEHLGVEFIDDRKLQQKALSMGLSDKDAESLDEKAPGYLDRLFTSKPEVYVDLLGAVVYDVAGTGEGVIVGHGAQHFLQDFDCALHVMIHASARSRSRWLVRNRGMSETAAAALVRNMDKRHKDFIQYAFDRDWSDPSGYDLVINPAKMGEDSAVRLVLETARAEAIQACSLGALEKMESSSLRRLVNAAILKHRLSTPSQPIFVEAASPGQVYLSGRIHSETEHRRLLEIVKGVPGVAEVRSDVLIFPSWVFS